jgi:SAM-dependent methyltransferase
MAKGEISDYYDRYWNEFVTPHELDDQLRSLYEAHVGPDDRCLDVGCGDGRKSGLWLVEHAGSYVGVDVSEVAVDAARRLGLDGRRIDDAAELPFADGSFDVVVCTEVLEHLFAPQIAVAELRRVLRPGGTLIVTVPNVAYWRKRLELSLLGRWDPLGDALSVAQPWRDPHMRFFTRPALRRLLVLSGFESVRTGGREGAFLCDIPPFGRLFARRRSGVYRALERRFPSLLGIGLYAVAVKPDA